MAELAVTDGMPPPAGLPDGEVIVHRVKDSIWIAHADPRILIAAEILAQAAAGTMPHVWLDWPHPPDDPFYAGAVLKIDGVNRTVIYRITEYVPRVRGYIAEWPD